MSTSQEVLPPQEHLLKLRETLYLQAIEAAKLDFFSFTKFIAPSLVPDFKIGKHIEVICQKLQRVVTSPDPQILNHPRLHLPSTVACFVGNGKRALASYTLVTTLSRIRGQILQ